MSLIYLQLFLDSSLKPINITRVFLLQYYTQVYRKQGLATNLTNFVKDIADAHGIGLYAICDMVRGNGNMIQNETGRKSSVDANASLPGSVVILRMVIVLCTSFTVQVLYPVFFCRRWFGMKRAART